MQASYAAGNLCEIVEDGEVYFMNATALELSLLRPQTITLSEQ